MSDYASWSVVWRRRGTRRPVAVAAFPTRAMAQGWINEAAHRVSNDFVGTWNDSAAFDLALDKRAYWREAQKRSRAKARNDFLGGNAGLTSRKQCD